MVLSSLDLRWHRQSLDTSGIFSSWLSVRRRSDVVSSEHGKTRNWHSGSSPTASASRTEYPSRATSAGRPRFRCQSFAESPRRPASRSATSSPRRTRRLVRTVCRSWARESQIYRSRSAESLICSKVALENVKRRLETTQHLAQRAVVLVPLRPGHHVARSPLLSSCLTTCRGRLPATPVCTTDIDVLQTENMAAVNTAAHKGQR